MEFGNPFAVGKVMVLIFVLFTFLSHGDSSL